MCKSEEKPEWRKLAQEQMKRKRYMRLTEEFVEAKYGVKCRPQMTSSDALLDSDMPSEQIRLHMGEMSAQDVRNVKAAIRWANERATARIRELEVELALYKGFHDCVCKTGTHVIVPVEPTEVMMDAAFNAYDGGRMSNQFAEIYSAMIRAAQEPE
jgi:hypothetical protein